MESIKNYIIESLKNNFKLKENENIPENIKYAENVTILNDKYFIFVTETNKGYACALYNNKTNTTAYIYLNNIDNIIYHFEYILKDGNNKNIVTLGDDGELHYDKVKLKANLPEKYKNDIVDDNANKLYNNNNSTLEPNQLYGLIKRQNKGIWKISSDNYINKEKIKNDNIKICVDGLYYNDTLNSNYIDLVPNKNAGISKNDNIVCLYKRNLTNDNNKNVKLYFNENKILFLLVNNTIKYDGGNAIVCKFDKFENNTLYLKTSDKIKLTGEDSKTQFMVIG